MHNPRLPHWKAVKHILRYLKHTCHFGLHFSASFTFTLSAFSDADWAGCPDDRKSTGGYCVYFGNHLISWGSKKQPTVARSSTEAEYKSVANTTCELLWLQSLLSELGIFLVSPPTLWCDNISATYLTLNPVLHSRTKHVELDYHFVWERVVAKTLKVSFIPSKDQIADILTKPLSAARFAQLRSSLTVSPVPLASRGDVKAGATGAPSAADMCAPSTEATGAPSATAMRTPSTATMRKHYSKNSLRQHTLEESNKDA
ncbi:hypothetical protein F2P56_015863 [Juglans regia]|uniref:Secreted RxLR effector protein 161-like n=1 Tax=Juglans regia TaxID=51240 RepID=A0A833XFY0_JUGRE|nr:hypothetical protein F2P56_015863 [Juglans regia]